MQDVILTAAVLQAEGRISRALPQSRRECGLSLEYFLARRFGKRSVTSRDGTTMKFLIYLLRGFEYFAGITPASPENERRAALVLFITLAAGTVLLAALIYALFPAMTR